MTWNRTSGSLTWQNKRSVTFSQWAPCPCWTGVNPYSLIFLSSVLIKSRTSWSLLWQSPRHKGCVSSPADRGWFSGSISSQPVWSPHPAGESPLPPAPASDRLPGGSAADIVHCRICLAGSHPKLRTRPLCRTGGTSAGSSHGRQRWLEPPGTGCHQTPPGGIQSLLCPWGRRKGRFSSFVPGASMPSCWPGCGSEAGRSPESRWIGSWAPPWPLGRKKAVPLEILQMRPAWLRWMTLPTVGSRLWRPSSVHVPYIGNMWVFNFWMFLSLSTSAFPFLYALSKWVQSTVSQPFYFSLLVLPHRVFRMLF